MRKLACICLSLIACGLEERSDFLVGRTCDPGIPASCDPGQSCLPHRLVEGSYADFRCRDPASFQRTRGQEPPLAFCDGDAGLVCPTGLSCAPDRVRERDGGARGMVCEPPDDPFGPRD